MRFLIRSTALGIIWLIPSVSLLAEYPVHRPARLKAASVESQFVVYPGQVKQDIKGLGFEIQSDSIANPSGRPDGFSMSSDNTSVPHDLVPDERIRFYQEMLKGFRYCRLAGGLYWRGLDPEQKYFQGRWPEQMTELKEMLNVAGIEGVSLEYWSPAPFWKSNGQLNGLNARARLRCFGTNFVNDPVYHGDQARFLNDFAAAYRHDLQYLRDQGIPISMWGLQNEPGTSDRLGYSCCGYSPEQYAITFKAVAPAIRAFDPKIWIIADSQNLEHIAPALKDPAVAQLVDAFVTHPIGWDSKTVVSLEADLAQGKNLMGVVHDFPEKPRFQNEYEYLFGPASPARCLNTVQNIMNWFQIAHAPTWFWIHALKPISNAEASGYALGFWRPIADTDPANDAKYGGLKPGHWIYNKYNWYAVGSFVRHLPWDSHAVAVDESDPDDDLRIFAFKRPNGKLTIVLSNRCGSPHTFQVNTGLAHGVFKGFKYTPETAGTNCLGVEIGTLSSPIISPKIEDMSWEFWEEQ